MTQPQTPPQTVAKNGVTPTLPINDQENTEIQDTSFSSSQNAELDTEKNEKHASIIAKAWRNHRTRREIQGKVISSESRDKLQELQAHKKACMHLPDDNGTCPVWLKWEDLLDAVESQIHRKDSKMALAIDVVELKDHMWLVLDTEHWLEICDFYHRYGANLKIYHDYWLKTSTPQSFFPWLDEGEGKDLDLKARPRKKLEEEKVKYLSGSERADYEVIFKDGLLIYKKSGKPVHTLSTGALDTSETNVSRDPSPSPTPSINEEEENTPSTLLRRPSVKREKWIYVTDCLGNFYVGQKIKGHFHHSSFLAGGAIAAAGGIKVQYGKLIELNPKSGHYKPAQHHFKALVDRLKDEDVDLSDARLVYPNDLIEKQIVAEYKVKRFADLALVYHQFDSQVANFSNTFRRNVKSFAGEVKFSLRELFYSHDQIEVQALNTNDKSGSITNESPEGKIERKIIEEDPKVNQSRKSLGIFHEVRKSISSSILSLASIIFGQDNKTDDDSSTGSKHTSFRDNGDYEHHKSRLTNNKLGHSKDHGENSPK
ncbi:20083_t:CDS:2 [Gigaspora margarita]|uniref:20083_t:CDS:1 n=1 Tax=Gigaspora margarita TaxID=4874 RepID=A0ABM8VYD6_GIGMA|nr:20083_t:CDS:2 [Gigaspora margarita]